MPNPVQLRRVIRPGARRVAAVSAGGVTPGFFDYLRPDGTSYFKRPDGTSYYTRP